MTGISTACGRAVRPLRKDAQTTEEVKKLAADEVVAIALAPINLQKDLSPSEDEFERGYSVGWNSAIEQINQLLHYRKLRAEGRYAPEERTAEEAGKDQA